MAGVLVYEDDVLWLIGGYALQGGKVWEKNNRSMKG